MPHHKRRVFSLPYSDIAFSAILSPCLRCVLKRSNLPIGDNLRAACSVYGVAESHFQLFPLTTFHLLKVAFNPV